MQELIDWLRWETIQEVHVLPFQTRPLFSFPHFENHANYIWCNWWKNYINLNKLTGAICCICILQKNHRYPRRIRQNAPPPIKQIQILKTISQTYNEFDVAQYVIILIIWFYMPSLLYNTSLDDKWTIGSDSTIGRYHQNSGWNTLVIYW